MTTKPNSSCARGARLKAGLAVPMKKQVSLANLREGPIRHPTLPAEFIERIRGFKEILGDADPVSLAKTIDSFKRDDDQIHRRDAVGMVMKKRLPALRRWFSSLDHIFGNARLSDTDPELEHLSVDPRGSPQRIGNAHLADKLPYLRR